MTEENMGNNSAASKSTFPVKRRRGRPRKDGSVSIGENSSGLRGSDGTKKNQNARIDSTAHDDSAFVGQVVSGILDGSFDAGYLLTVKVGSTNTVMRGVVFDPQLSVPISVENDVAPQVKMYRRSDIPLPIPARPLNQVPPIMACKEVNNEKPTNLQQCNVTVLKSEESLRGPQNEVNHVLPQAAQPSSSHSKDKTKSPATLSKGQPDGVDQAAPVAPQAHTSRTGKRKSDHITKNGVILLPYYPVPTVAAQVSQSEVKNQAAVEMTPKAFPSEPKSENQTLLSQENRTSIQTQGLSNGADTAPEVMKSDAIIKQPVKICQASETGKELPTATDKVPEVQIRACSELRSVSSVGVLKGGPSSELDYTLAPVSQPFTSQPVTQPLKKLQENKASLLDGPPLFRKQDSKHLRDTILKKDEGAYLTGSTSTDAVGAPYKDLQSTLLTANQPLGAYGAPGHEIPNLTAPTFAPKDAV